MFKSFLTMCNFESILKNREIIKKRTKIEHKFCLNLFHQEALNWAVQCQIAEEFSDLPELYVTIDNIDVVVNILLSIQSRDVLLNHFMVETLHMKPLPSSKVGLLKQFTKAFLHCFIENKLSPYFVGCPMLQAVSCAVIMVLVVP